MKRLHLFSSPYAVFGTLMLITCVTEIVVMSLLPALFPNTEGSVLIFADSFLLTALSAPFGWWLIVRPFRIRALKESARADAVLGSVVDAVISFDAVGNIESINRAAEQLFGYAPREIVGQKMELILPGLAVGCAGAPGELGSLARCKDGSSLPVESSVSRLDLEGRRIFIAIVHDISRHRQLAAIVEEQKEFLESLVQQSAVPTFVISPENEVLIWNRACEELTGLSAAEMLGRDEPWKAFSAQKRPVLANLVISGQVEQAEEGYSFFGKSSFIPEGLQAEGWYGDLNGCDRYLVFNAAPIRNNRGELLAVIETLEDITERKRYQEQLEYQANYDGLTSLPNRNLLGDRIRQALLISYRSHQEVGVFVIDLDNFKLINDTLGRDGGNTLLKAVADRLKGCLRSGDTVAHQGGDDFTVVISDQSLSDNAALIAGNMLEVIARPLRINGHDLVITASIGISIAPKDGEDVQALLKNAELAMYRAKEQGRNTYQFYTGQMNARSLARMSLEHQLRAALQREEFLVYYQPKVNARTGSITGMEALVRWQSPEMGLIAPDTFIPLAEEIGLIVPLGAWVLRAACAQNMAWQDAGLPPLTVSVNLSPRQFRQQDIASLIEESLAETGLDPRFLELEITESMVMHDADRVTAVLGSLKRLGTSLSMDDFGTGYSSLSYLKRFPFDKLKIDKSFVRDITCDPDNAAIAKAIIAMAHSLHMKVIAEGVETKGQLEYLRSQGCDEMQGFYFSKPVPAPEFERLLREQSLAAADLTEPAPGRKLLLVDDEERVTRALQRLLFSEGYEVLTANSATKGFELLSLNRVAVIVSDFRMPGMNGAEFLGRVKELYPSTVRLVLSGHADLDAITEFINVGAIFKILRKPWRDDEVRDQISAAFSQYDLLYGEDQQAPHPSLHS